MIRFLTIATDRCEVRDGSEEVPSDGEASCGIFRGIDGSRKCFVFVFAEVV